MWDGDNLILHLVRVHANGSEPTVWDGDDSPKVPRGSYAYSSEPTVWDGDSFNILRALSLSTVPSPPCGMETRNLAS